ncbi:DUF4198 domain-containing protein, partial [bacterium]|nr:DUF4198 domain-containing protein [bacterium]
DEYVLYYGHAHASHGGAEYIEYEPEDVLGVECFDSSGASRVLPVGDTYPLRVRGECAACWFLISSGYWTKTPYGTRNLAKDEVEHVIESWRSLESVKRIDVWCESLRDPLTDGLEIVPLIDPLSLTPGEKLRLKITFEGDPVEGAVVAYGGKVRGLSDEDGLVNVRIKAAGFQSVSASIRIPIESDKADLEIHTGFLNFELGGEE